MVSRKQELQAQESELRRHFCEHQTRQVEHEDGIRRIISEGQNTIVLLKPQHVKLLEEQKRLAVRMQSLAAYQQNLVQQD